LDIAFSLVVIDDLDTYGAIFRPHEADAILPIDSDGILALAIAAQILDRFGGIHQSKLIPSLLMERWQSRDFSMDYEFDIISTLNP
jgi:hypothetical protein